MILRKRKMTSTDDIIINKKRRIINWNDMISASSIRNYMLDDPLLDWLKYYKIETINSKPILHKNTHSHHNYNNSDTFNNFIMEQGLLFEKQVFDILNNKYNVVQVAYGNMSQSEEKFAETINYMKNGAEIIYQGVLHDYTNMLYGCPDLLVRSDRFEEIFKLPIPQHNSINFNQPFHYVVVDVKHSTLTFAHDKIHLLNSNSIPAYKGQLLIYNRLLESVQGYRPNSAYILGKKWIYTKNNITYSGNDYMTTLATINYSSYDESYNNKTEKAVKWLQDMRTQGHKWKLLPKPSRSELYPNMKNDKDNIFHKIKVELSDKIREITSIWWCGYNKRVIAHSKKIYSWMDKRCTSKNLNFNNNNTSNILDCILNMNRQNKLKIRTHDLMKVRNEWKKRDNVIDFYIDFETMNHNIGQVSENDTNDTIFMIGLGFEKDNEWIYKSFILKENTRDSEILMLNEMYTYINTIMSDYTNSRFIHWTQAEPIFYNKILKKYNIIPQYHINFYDMHKLFLDNKVIVKGALNFSLKTIATKMFNHGMISTCWSQDSICNNGLNAMYLAYTLYQSNNINPNIMNEIERYNEIDCKVMWDILKYLRNIN
jgi:hypothetical protein